MAEKASAAIEALNIPKLHFNEHSRKDLNDA
jgi:hypothetical protein